MLYNRSTGHHPLPLHPLPKLKGAFPSFFFVITLPAPPLPRDDSEISGINPSLPGTSLASWPRGMDPRYGSALPHRVNFRRTNSADLFRYAPPHAFNDGNHTLHREKKSNASVGKSDLRSFQPNSVRHVTTPLTRQENCFSTSHFTHPQEQSGCSR